MEPASVMQIMPFRKDPRRGQLDVIEKALERKTGSLNCQLPTGYGKTFTACAIYSGLRKSGVVDRLLYIVPSVGQLEQFVSSARDNFLDVALDGPSIVKDVGFQPTRCLRAHQVNEAQVFACTVQSLTSSNATREAVDELLQTARWMIVVDEYHHYGCDKAWGKLVAGLRCVFRLAMSATPYREKEDSAFGKPEVCVSYRTAQEEGAVKQLICHSYVYRIDAITKDGKVCTYTTDELAKEVGSASPEAIEKWKVDREMRWSPKYVSPLVDTPISRMVRERLDTGVPQQVLIGAMCCSHAKLVCDQVRTMFPELRIDWVGTGPYGRTDEANAATLKKFCPPKRDGRAVPEDVELDVLIHVGMAGEGLDSVYVTEIVHLNPANINNTNNQENGRAARVMPDVDIKLQKGRINVDSSSEYAAFLGKSVMDLMDEEPKTRNPGKPRGDTDDNDWFDRMLPEVPRIRIFDMKCIRIDLGEVERLKKAYAEAGVEQGLWGPSVLDDPDHPLHAKGEELYRNFRSREAAQFNEKSLHAQWRNSVEQARSLVTGKCIKLMVNKEARFPGSISGDIKKKLNTMALRAVGVPCNNETSIEDMQRHYAWYAKLQEELVENKSLPSWLQ